MIVLKILELPLSDGSKREVSIGIPDSDKEKNGMFRFRYESYLRHGYISSDTFRDGLDRDKYDLENKCIYFIAKVDNRIIGTVRLIVDDPLPTEKDCFSFLEPREMKKVDRSKRAELSRLIVEDYLPEKHFPRHFIMLGLLFCVTEYSKKHGLQAGYGFIKDKLKKKLERIRIPIHFIKKFKQIYNSEVLHGYFNDKSNPVWPIFYFADEVFIYLSIIMNSYFVSEGGIYRYREPGIGTKFLLVIRVYFLKIYLCLRHIY